MLMRLSEVQQAVIDDLRDRYDVLILGDERVFAVDCVLVSLYDDYISISRIGRVMWVEVSIVRFEYSSYGCSVWDLIDRWRYD